MGLRFEDVMTEVSGDLVSREQVERMCRRYFWARPYCESKDVIEAACGAGQGLGYLAQVVRSLRAGDLTEEFVAIARRHYGDRIEVRRFDAQAMPFADASADVVILFETIYFLALPDRFVAESRRVLRPEGKVLVATANKDLYEFIPAPMTHQSFGVPELTALFERHGFSVECFGDTPVDGVSGTQQLRRHAQRLLIRSGLFPKRKRWKTVLKRLAFGTLVRMPKEIDQGMAARVDPEPLPSRERDTRHKIIFCAATLPVSRQGHARHAAG